jgi:hypothetical protein
VDITLFTAATSPVLVGVVEVIKRASGLTDRFVPLIALVLGELAAFGARAAGSIVPSPDPFTAALTGAILGLTACGLYAGTRATLDK